MDVLHIFFLLLMRSTRVPIFFFCMYCGYEHGQIGFLLTRRILTRIGVRVLSLLSGTQT